MAKVKLSELTVFFPAYNEEGNIEKTVKDTLHVLTKNNIADKWEIIIVDDGSKDNTSKIADRLAKSNKRIRAVHHRPNRGYGGALKTGFSKAKYKWVAFTDSDGQFNFAEIEKFIKKQKKNNADLVLGIRKNRADSFLRKLFTFVWSKLLPKLIFNLNVKDYSCGFKLIRKKVFEDSLPLVGEEKVTQIELLVKAQRMGYKFTEVEVGHYPRQFGTQTGADLKVVAKSMIDLIKLWWQLR
jgi:glycosyltransferase involved in cell wall biosynthesis